MDKMIGSSKGSDRLRGSEALFSARDPANGAAEDMYVTFVIRSFKEARDEIAFLRYRFFAHGTGPSD